MPQPLPLGVTSFGMQILELPPNLEGYPEHDHAQGGQEEVYVVLRGAGEIEISLVQGQGLDLRRCRQKKRPDFPRHERIFAHIRLYDDCLRTKLQRMEHGHRRFGAELARRIVQVGIRIIF